MSEIDLVGAIVGQAAEDYRKHFLGYTGYEKDAAESKIFLRSEWFKVLCDLDGEVIMEDIEKEETIKIQKALTKAISSECFYLWTGPHKVKDRVKLPPKVAKRLKTVCVEILSELK